MRAWLPLRLASETSVSWNPAPELCEKATSGAGLVSGPARGQRRPEPPKGEQLSLGRVGRRSGLAGSGVGRPSRPRPATAPSRNNRWQPDRPAIAHGLSHVPIRTSFPAARSLFRPAQASASRTARPDLSYGRVRYRSDRRLGARGSNGVRPGRRTKLLPTPFGPRGTGGIPIRGRD